MGECRGAEALDMLQAMNTGHEGSLTTVHANTPHDAFNRLETMVMYSNVQLPSTAIRDQMAAAIHIVLQQNRLVDGSRKVVSIAEVRGQDNGTILLEDIFVYDQTGLTADGKVIGYHTPTGSEPKCLPRLRGFGVQLAPDMFQKVATH